MAGMAENPKLDLGTSRQNTDGIEENSVSQKISVLDHLNGFQCTTEKKADIFVIDMESFNNGTTTNKENNINSNSRITRNLSRKGSTRGGGSDTTTPAASSSPRGCSMPEKVASSPLVVVGTTTDHPINPQVLHHHIKITSTPSTDGRFAFGSNGFKRSHFSLAIDSRRVLFFFATLSSMGTVLLIYFTLSMGAYQD